MPGNGQYRQHLQLRPGYMPCQPKSLIRIDHGYLTENVGQGDHCREQRRRTEVAYLTVLNAFRPEVAVKDRRGSKHRVESFDVSTDDLKTPGRIEFEALLCNNHFVLQLLRFIRWQS